MPESAHRRRGEMVPLNHHGGAPRVRTGRRADDVNRRLRVSDDALALGVGREEVIAVLVEDEHGRGVDLVQRALGDFARDRVAVNHHARHEPERGAEAAEHLVSGCESRADDVNGPVGVLGDGGQFRGLEVLVKCRRRERLQREVALDADVEVHKPRSARRRGASVLVVGDPLARDPADGSEATHHVVHLAEEVSRQCDDVSALREPAARVGASHHRQLVKHEVRTHQRLRRCRRRGGELQRHCRDFVPRGLAQQQRGGDKRRGTVRRPEFASHVREQ